MTFSVRKTFFFFCCSMASCILNVYPKTYIDKRAFPRTCSNAAQGIFPYILTMIKQTVPHHNHYILFFKPYDVLCQFSHEPDRERKTLADYGPFPKNVYPVGRLDADSEGLVLLTDDKQLKHFLLEPRYRHPRTYLVQVERVPTEVDLECLRKGVVIEHRKTLPAEVELLNHEPKIPPRTVPIRFRKNIPTSWLTITLYE